MSLPNWIRGKRMADGISHDITEHLEEKVAALIDSGVPEEEARRRARREFGNPLLVAEDSRDVWGCIWFEHLLRDFRQGLRRMAHNPGFTAVAVLCLGLGAGATTAIFSVVDAVLFRRLPYAHADRLVRVFTEFPKEVTSTSATGFHHFWMSAPEYLDVKRDTQSFEELQGWVNSAANLAGNDQPVRATVSYVTGGQLQMLGVSPVIGRLLSDEDDRPNTPMTAVISYGLWQRAYAGDPAVIGGDLRLNGRACTLVGVMPRGFQFPPGEVNPPEVWLPLQIDPANPGGRGSHFLSVLGRLHPSVSLAQAQAEMDRYVIHSSQTIASNQHPFSLDLHPISLAGFQDEVVHSVRRALLVLLGAVAFVLLIACVNVANLLLAQSEARRREIAVRASIGAGAGQLLRQFLAEGTLLSLTGASVGLALAEGGLRLLAAAGAESIPRSGEIGINGRVLLFTLLVAAGTGLFFGLAPILHIRCLGLNEILKSATGRAIGSAATNRFRWSLVSCELALALILLIGSGLMVKAFWTLQEVNPGIDADHLLTMQLSLPSATYGNETQGNGFWALLIDRVNSLHGVSSATISSGLPPTREVNANDTPVENRPPDANGAQPIVDYWTFVDPSYFRTMRARLIEGRFLSAGETKRAPPAVVVNQTMARALWPHESALGHRVRADFPNGQWRTIVGVVGDIKNGGLDKPTGTELYIPYQQTSTIPGVTNNFVRNASLIIRTTVDPLSLANAVRAQVRSLDPSIPVTGLRTMDEVLSHAVARPRFLTLLMTLFSALSLILAALGIYGVMSYAVAQRTGEIGIRMALGAQRGHVFRLIGASGLNIVIAGMAAGALGAFALTRLLSGLLFGVSPLDVTTFFSMAAVLTLVTALACYLPARRATRTDPAIALRYE